MKQFLVLFPLVFFLSISVGLPFAQAQVEEDATQPGKERKLFAEDKKTTKDDKLAAQGAALATDAAPEDQVQFSAREIERRTKEDRVVGKGEVLISGRGAQIQADSGSYSAQTRDVDVEGNVLITSGQGEMSAKKAKFNLDTRTGEFNDASFLVEQGSFNLSGETIKKVSEDEYEILGANFSTCQCPDGGSSPWNISASRCFLQQEGQGHAYNASLWMYGVPVGYTPYLLFPVKTQRSTGLLAPTFGYSNKDGAQLRLPLFVVLDETQDLLFTPFTETKTRQGMILDYRQAIDDQQQLLLRGIFSDESLRETNGIKDLRGTDTTGIFDPSIDTHRFGGLMKFNWQTDDAALIPTSVVVDGKHASDNLLVREVDRSGIAPFTSTFLSSTAVMRSQFGDYLNSEFGADYTQDLFGDQDYALQRIPELKLNGQRSVRPFGFNPYGFKLTGAFDASATQFSRDRGYDGTRYNVTPSLTIPLRYQNIISTKFKASVIANQYSLSSIDEAVPGLETLTDDAPSTTVPKLEYGLSSSAERIYSIDDGSWFQSMAALGARNQDNLLRRVKHTIEPVASFQYVPSEEYADKPNFESSIDRIRERESVTYGVTSRLYGRFLPETKQDNAIQELTPEVGDISPSFAPSLLDDLSGGFIANRSVDTSSLRVGEVRELMNITLLELYDRKLEAGAAGDLKPGFSDSYGVLNLYPTRNVTIGLGATYDRSAGEVSSAGTGFKLSSDRGDALKLRYSYKQDDFNPDERDKISQLEVGTELVLGDRLRLGYFGRYDDKSTEVIESTGAIRLLSACNCWSFDVGFSQKSNPDREKVMATFTFTGLGDITQDIPFLQDKQGQGN